MTAARFRQVILDIDVVRGVAGSKDRPRLSRKFKVSLACGHFKLVYRRPAGSWLSCEHGCESSGIELRGYSQW